MVARKTKENWLAVGYATLGESGAAALTIDNLTRRLGVTKGSFYHHFRNYQDFQEQLLDYWVQVSTTNVVTFAGAGGNLLEVFGRFLASLENTSPSQEIAIRAWAMQDAGVAAYLARIDGLRVSQAQRWFQPVARDDGEAQLMARTFNALLVGCYSVLPPIVGPALRQTVTTFLRFYGIEI